MVNDTGSFVEEDDIDVIETGSSNKVFVETIIVVVVLVAVLVEINVFIVVVFLV